MTRKKPKAVNIMRRRKRLFALIDSCGRFYTNRLGDIVLFPTPGRAAAVADREIREEKSAVYLVTDATVSFSTATKP